MKEADDFHLPLSFTIHSDQRQSTLTCHRYDWSANSHQTAYHQQPAATRPLNSRLPPRKHRPKPPNYLLGFALHFGIAPEVTGMRCPYGQLLPQVMPQHTLVPPPSGYTQHSQCVMPDVFDFRVISSKLRTDASPWPDLTACTPRNSPFSHLK